ncbi:hypothetical protein CJ030_MR4G003863 [Morella rubra]|uniref:J domain-containing protein n=2 Tax=Morella rubra TaxID=262757 RepID=A0A6A1VUX5_9ROSI|nr:hypothetical protein CJ030_MR4G003863 [Morella rubra]
MARVSSESSAGSSMASTIKAYSVPLILLAAAIFYQLYVIPKSFPPSHYDVLGIKRYSAIEEVEGAYEKLSAKWNSADEVPHISDFIKIRYAYELLKNPLWKRNYDIFGIDEHLHVLEKVEEQYVGDSFSKVELPLLDATANDPKDFSLNAITSEDFQSILQNAEPSLFQMFSFGSKRCAQFLDVWKRIAALLDGVANTGAVELGDLQLAAYLAEKKPTGQPFFRKGLPSLVAFPPGCKTQVCLIRFEGELSVDAVTDWFATAILGLPRILYYSRDTLLPQLRSVTSMELGCDARGYSRAGANTTTWYCAILAGRRGPELDKMRETIRRVQNLLSNDSKTKKADQDESFSPAAGALISKRLTFAWLDGEAQKQLCFFWLHSDGSPETIYETCGPRRDLTDVPRLVIVRYKRNSTEDDMKVESKPKNMWDSLRGNDLDPASQLVARYNGSGEILQIIEWVSGIIRDGDSRDLPSFRTKTPELVPDDSEPILLRGAQKIISANTMKQRSHGIIREISDRLSDPRTGPFLLLGALMSFGTIWLRRSQQTQSSQSKKPNQPKKDEGRPEKRERRRTVSKRDPPPSMTDVEPKDAYQMPFSESDSE